MYAYGTDDSNGESTGRRLLSFFFFQPHIPSSPASGYERQRACLWHGKGGEIYMYAARVTAAAATAAIYQHEHRHAEQRQGRDHRASASPDELGPPSPFVGMHLSPSPSPAHGKTAESTQHPQASTQRPASPALSLSYSLTPLVKSAQDPRPTHCFPPDASFCPCLVCKYVCPRLSPAVGCSAPRLTA